MESVLLIKGIIILVIFALSLGIAAYETYFERVIAAYIQDRVGPDRAGPHGILQPLADAGKLFFKEDFVPVMADKWLFIIGPGIAMFTALMSSAVIPFGDTLKIGDLLVPIQGMDVNIGILWVFGVVAMGVYGMLIGGWASNNKYSLYGAIRAASQAISYEIALGLCLLAVILVTGSLSLREIATQQHGINWNVFYQPVGFILFFVCALAECNRTPFDLPETEAELVVGYMTEFGSMKMGLYMFAEYVNMFISSAIMASLYFGAYNYPGMDFVREFLISKLGDTTGHNLATLLGTAVFFLKIFMFIFTFMWIRWTLPRFKYEQLMKLGWQWMVPLAMVNLVVMAVATLSGKPLLVAWLGMGGFLLVYFTGRSMYEKRFN
ncbi:MAG: NADH-quinone oxidoreductase subunit NuoH [Leadbetterella sp.]|nr:NADH-quinone oxidoreductase subunit NuoH [Leadbetterella sp.]